MLKYKNILLVIVVFFLAYFLEPSFNPLFKEFFNYSSGIFFVYEEVIFSLFVIIELFIFFLTLLFTIFGGEKKYWWIGILLIPAAAFEIYFDFSHIYFPIALGLIGWAIGWLIYKFVRFQ